MHLNAPINLKCRVRENIDSNHEFQIPNFEAASDKPKACDWKSILDLKIQDSPKSVKLDITGATILASGTLNLNIFSSFAPKKPFDGRLQLEIIHKTLGCRWVSPLRLLAVPPTPDDTIIIQGSVKKQVSVSFTLKNPFGKTIPYVAYFYRSEKYKYGASDELSIQPQKGELVPEFLKKPSDNNMVISYKAHANGKSCTALLIIEVLLSK